ncbi:MAG TPA: protein kinase [Vicinamibacteria bacterium]|nr:protein kinase [Vicinamibacteria bacterium]
MAQLSELAGRYEIRAELGRGTMGVVYRAYDRDLDRDVALKVVRTELEDAEGGTSAYEQRFFNEARAAARLSHPAIVVVHDVGRDPSSGDLFMALELLNGSTLQAILGERARLPWAEALVLVEKVAEGLHHAHEHGIVHRDVKPANIMILGSGEPKIMDFGIAKLDASQLTAAGQLFGTPLYMSPEQALARPVDSRSDIFSLGSVAYEMLTGRRAFSGDSVHGIMFQVVQSEPPPPSSVVPGIPEGVDEVLARCLAKDPADRYPSGRALAEDLRAIRSGARPAWLAAAPRVDAEATLVSSRQPRPGGPGAAPPMTAGTPKRGPTGPIFGSRARVLVAVAVIGFAIGAGYLARARLAPAEAPFPSVPALTPPAKATVVPEGTPAASPAATTSTVGSLGSALGRVASLLAGPDAATVSVDFGHTLKSGRLRVWVDEKVVMDEDLRSRVTKRIAGLELRKGSLLDSFRVAPGRHEVRVQVTWDENVKKESIWANFRAGSQWRLEARLRGVGGLQDLSLKWR